MTRPWPPRPPRPPDPEGILADPSGPELVKEYVSTVLDTLAMLSLAVGSAWALWPLIGAVAVTVGGALLGVLNTVGGWLRTREPRTHPEPPASARWMPGPRDPGTLHIAGGDR